MDQIYSVSQINAYFKNLISRDAILSNVNIMGEISNFKHHFSGHMYFSLKDDRALIRCVMFSSSNELLDFMPENGMQVIANGQISIYERDGQYQLYVKDMTESGKGNLHLAFENLKKKLSNEGLFDEQHKKNIPFLPSSIGLITSKSGAVIQDIKNVLTRRFPNYTLIHYPVSVQGKDAHKDIIKAISYYNRYKNVDVIILARGGGSIEDLWSFNEEALAREIFRSEIPIVSAIGHETDYTISDFVADMRAPTPSSAAELVLPEYQNVIKQINDLDKQMKSALFKCFENKENRIKEMKNRPVFKKPMEYINVLYIQLDHLNEILQKQYEKTITAKEVSMQKKVELLESLNPERVLKRGYGIVYNDEKQIIKLASYAKTEKRLQIQFSDDRIYVKPIKED